MKVFLRGKAQKAKTFGDPDIIDRETFQKLEPPLPPYFSSSILWLWLRSDVCIR